MEKELKKAFQNINFEPKNDLAESVWLKVLSREKRIIRIKLYLFSSTLFLSVLGFVPVFKALLAQFTQSGFYEYLSLVFSNGNNLISYWKELGLSIIESLPILNIIFLLSLIFVFLWSLRYVLKQIINNNYIGQSYA